MLNSSPTTNCAGSTETNLVVACLRALVSRENASAIRESLQQLYQSSAEGQFDWEESLRGAQAHSVMPAVAYVLTQFGRDLVPEEVAARLRQRLQTAAMNNLKWLAEWRRASTAFTAAGIPVIPLKGPTLAVLAYGDVALREFADLDLLVRPLDALRARDTLATFGYQFRLARTGNNEPLFLRSGNRQLGFVNVERGMQIELHWGALHEMFPYQLPVDELFRTAYVTRHLGVSYLSLSPELYLLYLCAHGTKHCWPGLRWLCDVALYVQTAQELDWKLCMSLAESTNCKLVLAHSLLLANKVLGMDLPPEAGSLTEDQEAQALTLRAQQFLFLAPGAPSQREILRYHLAFAKSVQARIRFLYHRAFVPAEPDWEAVPLPSSLRLAYYLIRPVRILLHYLASGTSQG